MRAIFMAASPRPEEYARRPVCGKPAIGYIGRMNLLFQDSRLVVLNKPPGLAVHAGPSGGPSVEDWFPQLSRRKDGPWLAHRLDADTSGCLVIALRRATLLAAQALFASGNVRKTYWAVVCGKVANESGTIDAPLRRVTNPHGWRMVVDPAAGQSAVTDWRTLGRSSGLTWLEMHPRTGRTHQIRMHCTLLGTPILGDERYGVGGGGLHLLSRAIHLPLDPPVEATAPPPPHMLAALEQCGFRL
jgi:tRNA pseudouridine32 synthase / 23S rRNA pseudouridine746 synthase